MSSSRLWPSSPLSAAGRAFDLLSQPPAPLVFDPAGIPGVGGEPLALPRLRQLLMDRATPWETHDAVWRELVTRARGDGSCWVVVAAGAALPWLRRRARVLAPGWRGERADLEAEMLAGFLDHLRRIDLDAPRVCGRLVDAGVRAARRARAGDAELALVEDDQGWPLAPIRPWDHPDWVLARAVNAAVIDPDEANLIGATRLEGARLAAVADALGVSVALAAAWRHRAELRLAGAIRAGDLEFASIQHSRHRRRVGAAVNGGAAGQVGVSGAG